MANLLGRARALAFLIVLLPIALLATGCARSGPIDAARSFDEAVAEGDNAALQALAAADFDPGDPAFAEAAAARRAIGETSAEFSANIAAPQASVEVLLPEEDARFAVELIEEPEGGWAVTSYVEAQGE